MDGINHEVLSRCLFEESNDAFFIFAPGDNRIVDANPTAERLTGLRRKQLLGMELSDLLRADEGRTLEELIDAYQSTGVFHSEEGYFLTSANDGDLTVNISISRIHTTPEPLGLVVVRDVTKRNRYEEKLRASEQMFRTLAETVPATIAIYQGTCYRYMNPYGEDHTGYSLDELQKMSTLELLHPDFRELVTQRSLARQRGEDVPARYEFKFVTKDGQERWVDFSGTRIQYDGEPAVLGVTVDVTERKRAQEAIEHEQQLLRELLDIQERERQTLAFDIHDGLLQYAVGAQLRVEACLAKLSSSNQILSQQLNEAANQLRNAVQEGRRLIGGLRPPIIDDAGIVAAIKDLISALNDREGPKIEFVHDICCDHLATRLECALYRIVQEALTNVLRHSHSDRALVRLVQTSGQIQLEITDWGSGFDPAAVPPHRFGVRGIVERARLFGGSAIIESARGSGTTIRVTLPISVSAE